MSWTNLVSEAQFLSSLYPGSGPSLEVVVLHEVKLVRDGPVVTLRFDLDDFPADPPPKWKTQGFNTVQLTLMAIGVRRLTQSGWSNNNVVSITLQADNRGVSLRAAGADFALDVAADHIRVAELSAYLKEA